MNREKQKDGSSNERLEKLVFGAMRAGGWLLPQNADEVRAIEKAMESDPPEIPDRLADPYALLNTKRPKKDPDISLDSVRDPGIEENLSRVAREGKPISAEVAERMRKDREAAKRNESE